MSARALRAANPIGRGAAAELISAAADRDLLEGIMAAPRSTASPGSARSPRRLPSSPSPRPLAAALAVCVALACLAIFTAPGRAVTGWVGERIGLGQPGGHPALQALRHFATHGTAAQGQPAYVLLRGPGPLRGHYELVTYRSRRVPGGKFPLNGARCFEVEFPELRSLYAAGCGLPARGGLSLLGPGGNAAPGMEFEYVAGLVGADVAAVEVTVEGRAVPVRLTPVPADLRERLHLGPPLRFFIALAEPHFAVGKMTVLARDASGRVLARRARRIFAPQLTPARRAAAATASRTDPSR